MTTTKHRGLLPTTTHLAFVPETATPLEHARVGAITAQLRAGGRSDVRYIGKHVVVPAGMKADYGVEIPADAVRIYMHLGCVVVPA